MNLSNGGIVNELRTEKENNCQTHQPLTGPTIFWIQVQKTAFESATKHALTLFYSSTPKKKLSFHK
jgi:hypothetical protein